MLNDCIASITSLDDPRVALYRNVRDIDLRGSRHSKQLFLAESARVIERLIESPSLKIESFLLSRDAFERLRAPIERAACDAPIFTAHDSLLREISGYRHHGGALALGTRPAREDISVTSLLRMLHAHSANAPLTLLAAEGVTNVDNIGTLFRNAAAFGADGIILDGRCADPLFRKSIRFSMGSVFLVPFAVSDALIHDLHAVRNALRCSIAAAESGAGGMPVRALERFSHRLILAFGSEGHGLSHGMLEVADVVVEIPMSRDDLSLNVGVASAVLLYEAATERAQRSRA